MGFARDRSASCAQERAAHRQRMINLISRARCGTTSELRIHPPDKAFARASISIGSIAREFSKGSAARYSHGELLPNVAEETLCVVTNPVATAAKLNDGQDPKRRAMGICFFFSSEPA